MAPFRNVPVTVYAGGGGGVLLGGYGGWFLPIAFSCLRLLVLLLSPTGDFLSIAKESHQRTPAEAHGFCTSFSVCKSCYLNPAETGNRLPPTHAAATWAVEETFISTVGNGLPSGRRIIPFTGAGAAAGLLQSQFPLRPITSKALAHQKEIQKPSVFGGNRRSAACGGCSEAVSRKCPVFHATTWLEIG